MTNTNELTRQYTINLPTTTKGINLLVSGGILCKKTSELIHHRIFSGVPLNIQYIFLEKFADSAVPSYLPSNSLMRCQNLLMK